MLTDDCLANGGGTRPPGTQQGNPPVLNFGGEAPPLNFPLFTGKPGETVTGPRTTRRYGSDGYPEVDRDWDVTHSPPDHVHDWGRNAAGVPTHGDRGAPRPPGPGDPPPPFNNPGN